MARKLQKEISKFYHVEDVDMDIEVIETTRVEVLDYISDLIEMLDGNIELYKLQEKGEFINTFFETQDMTAVILYKDGTIDYINECDYENHKIRKTNIKSMMYEDGYVTRVFGNYEVNEHGVVTIS